MAGFTQRRAQALTRHLEQTEARDVADLDARTILTHRFAQAVFDRALVAYRRHVDEVDDNQAAEVTQTQLAAISSAASRLVLNAVSSMSPPRVARRS
jgi:hypothetical protein